MSIRIGLYDFFAYTLPGVFYLLTAGFWLASFGVLALDLETLSSFSISIWLLIVGAGYITGLLIDQISYRWMRIFYKSRNRDIAKYAFNHFQSQHPWLVLNFQPTEWELLMRAIKGKSLDVAADVEQHNIAFIMLRNISFGLFLNSLGCLAFFFANANAWNLLLVAACLALSAAALRRAELRRRWFYTAVFEAFAAYFLLNDKLAADKQNAISSNTPSTPAAPEARDDQR